MENYEKKDFRQLYENLVHSDWFKRAYNNKDIGECPFDIPELRESEDEKIRKAIFKALSKKDARDVLLAEGVQVSEALAYLEKQKEQKPSEKQDYSGLTDFERAIHRGFLCAGVENVPVTIIKETAQDCLAHLPAEWSEEDEKKIHFLSRLINFQVNDGEYCFGGNHRMVSKQEAIEMLLSLRPSWKPSENEESRTENRYEKY